MSTNDSASDLPVAFRAPRRLKALNVVATAASLAALSGSIFSFVFSDYPGTGAICAATTFLCALAWAAMLRVRSFPQTLMASVSLAPLNASLAYFLALSGPGSPLGHETFSAQGLLFVVTIGAIIWGPALFLAWILFGVPLIWAKRLAERGLGSEDRGERLVAIVAGVFALVALFGAPRHSATARPIDLFTVFAMGVVAVLTSGAVAKSTTRRERARLDFLHAVKAGERSDYRVERLQSGKDVLLRVRVVGEGYRVAPLAEEIVEIDSAGDAKRAVNVTM